MLNLSIIFFYLQEKLFISSNMYREEIIKEGQPVEPYCFETDREEQWYKVGRWEGATSEIWHKVSDGELPPVANTYLNVSCDVLVFDGNSYKVGCYYYSLNKWIVDDELGFNVIKWQFIIDTE